MNVLIALPTYNEKENLELMVEAIREVQPEAEILVVDDNSPDGTGDIAESLAGEDSNVHVLHREKKEGLGPALVAAFQWMLERDYDLLITMDCDFSHDPKYLADMIRLAETNDLVTGSRRVPGGGSENWGLVRQLVSAGGSLYARMMLGLPVKDVTAGFNAYRRHVLEALDFDALFTSGYARQIELKYRIWKGGAKLAETPIVFPDRVRGNSKMSSGIFFEALLGVAKLRLRG